MANFFTQLNWLDYVIIAVIVLSVGISFARGFMQEILSLLTWVLAFALAIYATPYLANYLTPWINSPTLRVGLSFIGLLLIVFILGSAIKRFVSGKAKQSDLSFIDRLGGAIFGLVRGGLIVAILLWIGILVEVTNLSWWTNSKLTSYFLPASHWIDKTFQSSMHHIDKKAEQVTEMKE